MPIDVPVLRLLFDSLGAGVYAIDTDGLLTACNPETERLVGYPEQALIGQRVHDLLHHSRPDGSAFPIEECTLYGVVRSGRAAENDDDAFIRQDGAFLPVSWVSAPIVLAGEVTGAVVVFRDATSQREARQRRTADLVALSEANERLTLLAEVTHALTASMELYDQLRRLADLVVPRLADWSVVDLLTDTTVERVAIAHRDPDRMPAGREGPLPPLPERSTGSLARVLNGAEPSLVSTIPSPSQAEDPLTAEQLSLFADLGATSAIVAPLRARGRTLGALTLVRTDPTKPYGSADVSLADDLARRAALAVDNARLYESQRRTAETLQRSLLSPLPRNTGFDLAARYVASRRAAQIGGDWYDGFVLPDGGLALVIGDVVGHDVEAAGRMGQLRSMLRMSAVESGAPPSRVLGQLDRAIEHLDVVDMATAVYARIERLPDGWRLSWCNAGHPAPLLVRPDGGVELLEEPSGLVLGLADLDRVDGCRRLEPGTTVLLYTDGLVEVPGRDIDVGLDRLLGAAERPVLRGTFSGGTERLVDEGASRALDDRALLLVWRP